MARASTIAAGVALVGGAALIGASVALRATQVFVLGFIPVFTGSSLEFLAGTLLLIFGMVLFAVSRWGPEEAELRAPPTPADPLGTRSEGDFGGVILIGPVPIFFGGARGLANRYYWLAAGAGVALVAAVVVVLYLA